ncbi:hypothetical protein Tco_1203123 [Tanacetum coccineum]
MANQVITYSVSLLKPSDVFKLLESLIPMIQSRGAVAACALPWIKSLLLQHANIIMYQKVSLIALNSLYQVQLDGVAQGEEGYLETNPSTSPEHMFVAPDGKPNAPVDSYISGKIVQLKEQIATLEKREESIRQFLQKEYMFSAGRAVNYLVTRKKNDDLKKKMEDERVAVKAQRAADIVACVKHSMIGWSLLLRIILPELSGLLNRIQVFGIRL